MPFGLTNAPSTCISLMIKVLRPYNGNFMIVCLDDISVFNKTKEEHLQHPRLVWEILGKEKLHIYLKKCNFFKVNLYISVL
jgi:hypothetical protein